MKFYESNSYIWFLGRIFGLFYFTNNQNTLKITTKSLLLSLLPGCVFILVLIFASFTVQATEDDFAETFGSNSTTVLLVVSIFGIISQFGNCIVIMIVSYNKREKILHFYKTVNKLDAILEKKLNIYFNYESMRNKDFKKLIIFSGYFVVTFGIISYAYTINITYISISILSTFTYGTDLFTSIDYYYSIKIIQFRFKSLNTLITETSKITANQLEILIESHFTLNRLILDLNQIHGFKKLLNITNDFVFVITQLYAIFVIIDEKMFTLVFMKVLLGLLVMPVLAAKMVMTAICCEETVAYKKLFGQLLKTIDHFECNGLVSDLVPD